MMHLYAVNYHKSPDAPQESAELEIADQGLVLHFKNRPREVWPYADCFAGQVAQGEGECIGNNKQLKVRVYTRRDVIEAVKAAIKGTPHKLPPTHLMPWPTIILFSFLALCAIVWFFAR